MYFRERSLDGCMCLLLFECMLDSFACTLEVVLLYASLLDVIPVAWLLERSIAEFFLRRD